MKDSLNLFGAKEALQQPLTINQSSNDLSSKSSQLSALQNLLKNSLKSGLLLLFFIYSNLLGAAEKQQQSTLTGANSLSTPQWFYIAPGKRKIYDQFYEQIKHQLKHTKITRIDSSSDIICPSNADIKMHFITAGITALKKIQHCTETANIFGFYLTQQQFYKLTNKSNDAYKNANIFFADQPLIRQLALARYFLPKNNKVGIVYNESVQHQIDYFKYRKPNFITLSDYVVNTQNNLLNQLSKATSNSDFILALIDSETYNSRNAKSILLSTYRQGVPLFGGTRGFVKAGIVASCYSIPEKLVDELTTFISKHPSVKGARQYPIHFEVEQNNAVLNSLDLTMPDKKDIKAFISETLLLWRNL